jgi:hypothetical protein
LESLVSVTLVAADANMGSKICGLFYGLLHGQFGGSILQMEQMIMLEWVIEDP